MMNNYFYNYKKGKQMSDKDFEIENADSAATEEIPLDAADEPEATVTEILDKTKPEELQINSEYEKTTEVST